MMRRASWTALGKAPMGLARLAILGLQPFGAVERVVANQGTTCVFLEDHCRLRVQQTRL